MKRSLETRVVNITRKRFRREALNRELPVPPAYLDSAERLVTNERYLTADPTITTSFSKWNRRWVILKAGMGSAKTELILASIIALQPKRCIFTSANNATLIEIKERLVSKASSTRVAYHTDPLKRHFDDWEVLFVHPRSLALFESRECDYFIIDELSAVNQQLLSWNRASPTVKKSIDTARAIFKYHLCRADHIVLAGAQISDRDIQVLCETISEPEPFRPLLLVSTTHPPRMTELEVHDSHPAMLEEIWQRYITGKRVVAAVATASGAKRHHLWLCLKIQQLLQEQPEFRLPGTGEVPSVLHAQLWSADSVAQLGKGTTDDVSSFLTSSGARALFHTSALSPGTSINHALGYWSGRFLHLCARNLTSLDTLAQIINRVRNIDSHKVFTFIEPSKKRGCKAIAESLNTSKAIRAVFRDNPDEEQYIFSPETGLPECKLGATFSNELRLDLIYDRQITDHDELIRTLASKLDAATVRYVHDDDVPQCPLWKTASERVGVTETFQFLSAQEIERERMLVATGIKRALPEFLYRAIILQNIRAHVRPAMVTDTFRHGNRSLTSEAFAALYKQHWALTVLRDLTYTEPDVINAAILNRVGALESSSTTKEFVKLQDRIYPSEVIFLATRLLLDIPLVREQFSTSTLNLIRSHLTCDLFSYLHNFTIHRFVTLHKAVFMRFMTKTSRDLLQTFLKQNNEPDLATAVAFLRICLSQAGISVSHRSSKLFHYGAKKPWLALGMTITDIVASFDCKQNNDEHYGIEPCAMCDSTQPTYCVRQGGIWRCVFSQSVELSPHRELDQPLDLVVNLTDTPTPERENPSDGILEILGFVGGKQSELKLSKQEVELNWNQHAAMRASWLQLLDDRAGSKFVDLIGIKPKIFTLLAELGPVLNQEGMKLERRYKQCDGKRIWLYQLATI